MSEISTDIALSVVVPVYNAEKYIEECIRSLLFQSLKNIEVIAVDDGSTDKSLEVLKKMSESDKRLRVFHQENSGVSSARNYGLREARGQYIGFCDSDDWTEKNMYESMYAKAVEYNADIVFCGIYKNADQADVPYIDDGYYPRSEIEKKIFPILVCNTNEVQDGRTLSGSVCSKLISNRLIKEHDLSFDTSKISYEDYLFCIKATFYAQSYYYMGSLHFYHVRRNVVSSTKRYMKDYWNKQRNVAENLSPLVEHSDYSDIFLPQINRFVFIVAKNAVINETKLLSLKTLRRVSKGIRTIVNDELLRKRIYNIDKKELGKTNRLYLASMKYKFVFLLMLLGLRSWKSIENELG